MGKALKTAGVIIGAAALIATGVGALAMPGLAGATTLFGVSTGTLNTISSGLIAVGGMLDKPKSQGSAQPDDWTSNPDQPIPFLFGRMGVAGKIVQRDEFGPDNMYQGIVGILSGAGPIKGVLGFKGDDQPVTFGANGIAVTSQWQGEMWMVRRAGNQPDTVLTVPPGLKSGGSAFQWSGSARLSGKACYLQVLGENSKGTAYPAGVPEPVHDAEGIFGYDPRYDSTYPGGDGPCRLGDRSTYRYIDNPIIAGLNWALGMMENGKVVGGIGASPYGIDFPAFVEAANISDANNWSVAAWPDTSEDVSAVLDQFLQAGGAKRARHAGKISCVSRAAPRASVVTITARDMAGTIELNTAPSLFDALNTITPRFMSEAGGWKLTPADAVSFASLVTEDGGKHSDQIDYRFVPGLKQAAELAAYDILDAREPFSGSVPLKPHMRQLKRGDCFIIDEPGVFLDGVKCIVLTRSYDAKTAQVRIGFRSETDSKHPLALGKTTTMPAFPVLTPTDPTEVSRPLPGDWTITPRPPASGGSQQPGFGLTGFVSNSTATAIIVETGPSATGPWTQAYQGPPTVTNIPVDGLQSGATYFVAIQYQRDQNYSEREVFGPFTAPSLVSDDTNNVGGRPAPEVIQQLDDILIDVDGISTDVGAALDQASEAKTLAASSGYPSMNPNSVYAKSWESGVPPEWVDWGAGGTGRRAAGIESANGFQIDVPSTGSAESANRGIFQPSGVGALNTASGEAYYVAELTVRLDAGLLNGTGMHIGFYNSSGVAIGSTNINASADEPLGAAAPGNGVVGRVYRYARLFKTDPGTVTLVPYAMGFWNGYYGEAVGKTVTITKCRVRPADAGEIEEGKARGSYPTLESRLTDQNTSLVSATAALALRQSVTEARATTLPNRLRNSDAALKMRYWTSGGSGALWSYYDDGNFGTLFGALGGPNGADYFLISDLVAVYSNSTYTLSFEGDGGTRPGEAYAYISQYDAAGNYIPAGDGLGFINFVGVNWTTRKSTTFTTRPDCAFIKVVFQKKGGPGFNAFVSRIMLSTGVIVVGWTDAATAKDIGGRVETSEGVLATVSGRVQAWFQKVVQAGDGTAFIQAKAIDDNGNVTSEVNLGARKIGMFTQIGNGWVEVLKLIGTSAHFAGKVFLGALQQITFDPDIPALIFTPPGGSVKMLYGAGFGVNADCIMWLGPKATDVSQISRTNGNWAFGTDGKVYYGSNELTTGGGGGGGGAAFDRAAVTGQFTGSQWTTIAQLNFPNRPSAGFWEAYLGVGAGTADGTQSPVCEMRIIESGASAPLSTSGQFTIQAGGQISPIEGDTGFYSPAAPWNQTRPAGAITLLLQIRMVFNTGNFASITGDFYASYTPKPS